MKRRLIMLILLGLFLSKLSLANESLTPTGRYLTVSNHPKMSQLDLLSQSIQVRFPEKIQTIGEAINYLLRFSGYSLIADNKMNKALKITLTKPLPIIDRELGPMSLKEGLTTLAGVAFTLYQDPVNRVIDFKLKPTYQKFLQNE